MHFNRMINMYVDSVVRKILIKRALDGIEKKMESFVIMFHDVSFSNTNKDKYGINIDDFQQIIAYLSKRGYRFTSFSNLMNKSNYKYGYCVLTFDDGFCSTYKLMQEHLKTYNIPFQIYIVSDWIGKKGYISKKQLVEMSKESICVIGSHSCSHMRFRTLSRYDAKREMINSRLQIEKIINKSVDEFAFPYGSRYACSRMNHKMAIKEGYERIYTTIPSTLIKIDKDTRLIPRVNGVEIFNRIIKNKLERRSE